MTRSADDETVRVPAGCSKHPVHRPCLRRTPGRDPTLERRSPEVSGGGVFSIESCLSFTSWRALGPCLQDCDSLARSCDVRSSCDATQPLRHGGPARALPHALRIRHLAFCGSEDRRFRSGWLPRVPFPFGTEGHLASTTPSSPGGEAGRLRPHLSSCITREHHLASRSTLAESASPSARYETSSLMRAARRGLASSPTGARPIVSFRWARFCERRSSGRRRAPHGRPCVARGTKDTVSRAPAGARAGPTLDRGEAMSRGVGVLARSEGKVTGSLESVGFQPRGPTEMRRPAKERPHRSVPEVPPAAPPSGEGCSP